MKVYFDSENLASFFKQIDEHQLGQEILGVLKKQLSISFNFSLDSISEELEIQLGEFIEGSGRNRDELELSFSNTDLFDSRPVASVNNQNGIYLLNNISAKLLRENRLLISDVGGELDVLSRLIINNYDASLHEQRSISNDDFSSWDEIHKYVRPFSSMIIVDRYMFKGSLESGNLSLFKYNLQKALSHYFENIQCKTRLIFIFQIKPLDKIPDLGPDENEIFSLIKRAVKSKNRHCPTPEIALIYVAKNIDDEHDRNIISNYNRFKSGDTFIYFNSDDSITTQSSDLDVYSLGKLQYRKTTNRLKGKLIELVAEVQRLNSNRIKTNFELNGDLINF